jgi:hypothetical protein
LLANVGNLCRGKKQLIKKLVFQDWGFWNGPVKEKEEEEKGYS